MKEIQSPFGTMLDEQAMIDQFYELHGRRVAESLDRIMQNSYPSFGAYGRKVSKLDVFRTSAKRQGFTDWQINDFLQLV